MQKLLNFFGTKNVVILNGLHEGKLATITSASTVKTEDGITVKLNINTVNEVYLMGY